MKKILSLLPILVLSVAIPGCKGTTTTTSSSAETSSATSSSSSEGFDHDHFVYTEAEEVPINVEKEGTEILYINIVNIPSDGIQAAKWDDYDIKFDVTYSDGTSQQFPFLTKHFPMSSRHYLGTVGHHNVELMINNYTTRVGFNIIKNPNFNGYKCIFIDSRDGQTKYETTVGYYKTAVYEGEIPANQEKPNDVINTFVGWDYPVEYVHQDMIYTTHYRDVEKRFYATGIAADANPVITTHKENDSMFALTYLGRVCAVNINAGDTIYHEKGDASVNELHFNKINPYSDTWNETNESIFTNSLNYTFDATAAQYLFGASTSFNNSPTFLSNFENMYEVESKSIQLEDGSTIQTAINPNFKKCYDYAEAAMSETKGIVLNDETGYYRIALTCSFDIYVSLEFTKLNNDKFKLNGASELFFSPVDDTVSIRRQFSDDGVFGNYFNQTINYSNDTLLNIAKSLDWGNN